MRPNYTLRNDIVNNHNDRMNYLKKYIPFFRLQEMSLSQFKEGKYAIVDMGYVTMAVLRYFIEENHFNDRTLAYNEVTEFIANLLLQDFELNVSEAEEKELTDYIFDKIKNEGKPFTMDYFDPADKKTKTARMRLIESRLVGNSVVYSITADAIEFYLETKEVKDESKISIQQLLLEKMIAAKNFRGGTDVVKRINSEVAKLRLRKQEVLVLLGLNVFEGVKALEEFQQTGMQWFAEEQKAFLRNKDLTEAALNKAETLAKEHADSKEYHDTLTEIYELETELKKAMSNHSKLLADCMELQVKSDEIIHKFKFSRLRNAFDFSSFLEKVKEANDVSLLEPLVMPFMNPLLKKTFYLGNIDELLTYPGLKEEASETVQEAKVETYQFDDELEEQRISENYFAMLKVLMQMLLSREKFTLREFNQELELTYFDEIFTNSDYYSFLVHLSMKKHYELKNVMTHQDTFFDAILAEFLKEPKNKRYEALSFSLELCSDQEPDKGISINDQTTGQQSMLDILQPTAKSEPAPDVHDEIVHLITGMDKEKEFVTSNIIFVRETKES